MASRGVNKVILIGNLGNDPETRYMASGDAVTNLSVATSEVWKDKNTGEQREATEWHRVVYFGRLGEIAGQYLRKGSKIYIEGSLRTRKWQDQNGQDRYTTEIRGSEMQMLDSRNAQDGPPSAPRELAPRVKPVAQAAQAASKPAASSQAPAKSAASSQAPVLEDEFDDDIPFMRPAVLDGLAFPYDGAWFGNGPSNPYQRK